MKNIKTLFFCVIACAVTVYASAQTQTDSLQNRLQSVFGNTQIEIRNYDDLLQEVVVDSGTFFATHDGRYLFAGPVLDTYRKVDIVVERDNRKRKTVLDSQSDELFVSYPSSGTTKHRVTVFTDIDCPYCRKLHNSMSTFNQRGISVNYVMLPRAGVGSASYTKTLKALCSDNPALSITRAMQNESLAPASCETTQLTAQLELARELGIASTPTVVLPNGSLQIGLVSPDKLMALIEEGK